MTFSGEIALGDLFALVGLSFALFSLGRLRRAVEEHLQIHLLAVRHWAAGPAGAGWNQSDIESVPTMLRWHHPGFTVVPLPVATGLLQLTSLDNLFLSRELRQALVGLAIAVDNFNSRLEDIRTLDGGSVERALEIATKLNRVYGPTADGRGIEYKSDFGGKVSVNLVFQRAGLTDLEVAWVKWRHSLIRSAHETFIGKKGSNVGLFFHLDNVTRTMQRDGFSAS